MSVGEKAVGVFFVRERLIAARFATAGNVWRRNGPILLVERMLPSL